MAPAAIASSQNVTLPVISELYNPDFLDVLLPELDGASPVQVEGPGPRHPMIDALQATASRTRTTNNDPAYASTLSPTLDAFHALKPQNFDTGLNDVLAKAWKEDPDWI